MKRVRLLVLFCLFASVLPAILAGQTQTQTNDGQTNPANSPARASAASDSASGAAESKAAEPAPDKIVEYAPPPAQYARAKAYSNTKYRHVFIGSFYGFLVLLVILRWRAAPAFRDLAERVSSN